MAVRVVPPPSAGIARGERAQPILVPEQPGGASRQIGAAELAGLEVPPGTIVAVYRTDVVLDPGKPPLAARALLFTIER